MDFENIAATAHAYPTNSIAPVLFPPKRKLGCTRNINPTIESDPAKMIRFDRKRIPKKRCESSGIIKTETPTMQVYSVDVMNVRAKDPPICNTVRAQTNATKALLFLIGFWRYAGITVSVHSIFE